MQNTPPEDLKFTNTLPHHELFIRKGVYPYEYMDSMERFDETQLPPHSAFHSSLTGGNITDEEYERAKHVWTASGCESMRDYHDLYLESDVHLLADIFENFRWKAYKTYGLDPVHYTTLPGKL